MTYAEFVTAVLEELGTDGTRRGIESLRTRTIRNAVVDLQRYIRAFRTGHTTQFVEANMTEKGYAHLGTLPENAKPKAFYVVSTGETEEEGTTDDPNRIRNRLDFWPWEDRQSLIDDQYGLRSYKYTVSPYSKQFLIHPALNDEVYLLVVWDGIKMDFDDADTVPWPEHVAEAVGAYVKSRILRSVDKRPDLAQVEFGMYMQKRLALWRENNEAQVANGHDEEYLVAATPVTDPLSAFGAQFMPFLATVTQVEGADATALEFIPTTTITPNFAVQFLNGSTLLVETWVLKVGSDASDGVSVQRPADYNAATNIKCWYKTT